MKNTKSPPCKDCLVIAACRNKPWRMTLDDCRSMRQYLRNEYIDRDPKVFGHKVKVHELGMTLSVTQWQDQILVSVSETTEKYKGRLGIGTAKRIKDK